MHKESMEQLISEEAPPIYKNIDLKVTDGTSALAPFKLSLQGTAARMTIVKVKYTFQGHFSHKEKNVKICSNVVTDENENNRSRVVLETKISGWLALPFWIWFSCVLVTSWDGRQL